ncbi:MAG TPA: hypothetical protein VII56_09115 [Rhizomicrobium sp.]
MKSWFSFVLYGAAFLLLPAAALADGIPLDDAGFTAYIQQKLQLYSPAPVRVTAPFALAIGPEVGANLVFEFKPLHDACVADPPQCPGKTHDYVQGVVSRFPSANNGPAPAEMLPQDAAAFMAWIVDKAINLLPGDRVDVDGLTLNVTRPGGRVVHLDQSAYYRLCAESNFNCKVAMLQSLGRTAAWLAVADPARLRSSLRLAANCANAVPHGTSGACPVKPEPMAPISRRAFANLEEVCHKPVPGGGVVLMLNADRADLNLSVDAAFDLCDARTRDALPPLPAAPPPADGIVAIVGPYAASRALFGADGSGFAVGGHLLIAVPSRDLLLFIRSDSPADIAALGARAKAAYDGAPSAISSDVYRWTGKGWALATPASTMTPNEH